MVKKKILSNYTPRQLVFLCLFNILIGIAMLFITHMIWSNFQIGKVYLMYRHGPSIPIIDPNLRLLAVIPQLLTFGFLSILLISLSIIGITTCINKSIISRFKWIKPLVILLCYLFLGSSVLFFIVQGYIGYIQK